MTLDDDIASALRALRLTARSARRIAGTPSARAERATFRIVTTSGRVVKARRLSRVAVARRYVALVRMLRPLSVPTILGRRGRVTIETWIAGTPLDALPHRSQRWRDAGALLRAIHRTEGAATARRGRALTRPFFVDLLARLDVLVAAGALTAAERTVLARALATSRPSRARTGLTHNDFCGENLVEDAEGRLHVIDNGGLRVGFLDFDLARAWYRWSMSSTAWRSFLAGYGGGARATTGDRRRFWRAAAIIRSAHFRVVRASRDVAPVLRRLRALARDERRPAARRR